jgi:Tol biopolymer transport system component
MLPTLYLMRVTSVNFIHVVTELQTMVVVAIMRAVIYEVNQGVLIMNKIAIFIVLFVFLFSLSCGSTPTADTTSPIITAIEASGITATSVTITWTTNDVTTSQVEYGATTAYGSSTALSATQKTSHIVNLTSLDSGTTYYYRIRAIDTSGNERISAGKTFGTDSADTTTPIITMVSASEIDETSAIITWTTSEAATSQVEYGTTTAYGMNSILLTSQTTSHSITISEISSGTSCNYRVKSSDASGNQAISTNYTFSTVEIIEYSDNYDIYRMDANGSNLKRLTNTPYNGEQYPVFSPDGSMIAYISASAFSSYKINVMTNNGLEHEELSNTSANSIYGIRWFPNGGSIAYYSNPISPDFGMREINTVNIEDGAQSRLTDTDGMIYVTYSMNSDGTKIAYSLLSFTESTVDIHVMNADGDNDVNTINSISTHETRPAWSPDDEKIAYNHEDAGGNYSIYTMNADGTNQTKLTEITSSIAKPLWSPDGSKIAWHETSGGIGDIWVIDVNGTNKRKLTSNGDSMDYISWSPDSSKILFNHKTGITQTQICVVNVEDSVISQLTSSAAEKDRPSWSPDGNHILFAARK